ncbi:MAG: hypothetical protein QXI39_09925 [Candidatus Bathyarchaeia archaeon]
MESEGALVIYASRSNRSSLDHTPRSFLIALGASEKGAEVTTLEIRQDNQTLEIEPNSLFLSDFYLN